jgi:Na+/melibiose symporter-like transporter
MQCGACIEGASAMAKETQQVTLEPKVPWLFALNTFTTQFGIVVTLQFLNIFMTDIALIPVAAVALILTAGRIADMIISLFAGSIVQKANLKTGPYRTWILINGPLITIGVFLLFLNPGVAPAAKVAVMVAGYFFRNIPQNFILTAQNALLAKCAGPNIANRLAITAKNMIGTNAGAILTSLATLPLINYFNGRFPNRGYLIVGVTFGLFMALGQLILYIQLREYDKYDPLLKQVQGSNVNVKLSQIYSTTLKNSQVWLLLISNVSIQMATFTVTPVMVYFFRYTIGSTALYPVMLTAAALTGLCAAFFCPPIVKKIGKKNSQILADILQASLYVAIALLVKGNAVFFIVLNCLLRVGLGIRTAVGVNLWLDAAEYQLFNTGKDTRPFVMSVNAITMKIGQVLSSFSYAWILGFAGYDASGASVSVNAGRLGFAFGVVPALLYSISALTMSFFKINEEKSKEYAEANHKMMEERHAAARTAAG